MERENWEMLFVGVFLFGLICGFTLATFLVQAGVHP